MVTSRTQLVDQRVEPRVEADLRGESRRPRRARTSRGRRRSWVASGFSHSSGLPAATTARTRSRCVVVGVTMTTASTSGSSMTACASARDRSNGQIALRGVARRRRRSRRPRPAGPRRPRRAAGARRRGPGRSCRSRRGRSRWVSCRTSEPRRGSCQKNGDAVRIHAHRIGRYCRARVRPNTSAAPLPPGTALPARPVCGTSGEITRRKRIEPATHSCHRAKKRPAGVKIP